MNLKFQPYKKIAANLRYIMYEKQIVDNLLINIKKAA